MHSRLIVYQKSKALIVKIYKLTNTFPKSEDYNLTSQIKRAATSVALNIAEGQARSGTKEFINFLNIAYASNAEVKVCLDLAHELNFISASEFNETMYDTEEISKLIYSYKKSLSKKLALRS